MESSPDKKKKNFIDSWLDRLLQPRSLYEFETPLTPYQCYERLQKLPGKMAYLKAKNKVELANTGMLPFGLQWKPDKNVCEFIYAGRGWDIGLRGKVFVSEIYETTLVQCRRGNKELVFHRHILPFLMLIPVMTIGYLIGGYPPDLIFRTIPLLLGEAACAILFALFLFFAIGIPTARADIKLLRIVLTEPDESKL